MEEEGIFPMLLMLLKEECNKDGGASNTESLAYKTAVNTMLKLMRNVRDNPSEEKYRRVRLENKAFSEKVWSYEGAQQLLLAAGWLVVDDCIVLTEDVGIRSAVEELEKELRRLQPAGSQVPSQVSSSPVKEENKEIAEARKRQLEAVKREKEEKRRISEQIQADRQEIQARPMRNSRATERRFGANIKRFEDIGVDLNGGGG